MSRQSRPQSKGTATSLRQVGSLHTPACLLQLKAEPLPSAEHLEAQQKLL